MYVIEGDIFLKILFLELSISVWFLIT